MICAMCQWLEEELPRLERIHAEKAQIRADNWRAVSFGDYGRLRTAENDAMLARPSENEIASMEGVHTII